MKTLITIISLSALIASLATISINQSEFKSYKANQAKEIKCAYNRGKARMALKKNGSHCSYFAESKASQYGMAY